MISGGRIISEYKGYDKMLGRVRLIDALPLKYPLSLIVDPCNVCLTGQPAILKKINRPSGMMSMWLFKKIMDDCKVMLPTETDRIKRLFLDKDGEPLLNKNLFDMIRYAKESEAFISVEVSTNASLLNDENISKMIESGLDAVRISIELFRYFRDVVLGETKYSEGFQTSGALHISPASATTTASGTCLAGRTMAIRVKRMPAEAGDTMSDDARFLGLQLTYTKAGA